MKFSLLFLLLFISFASFVFAEGKEASIYISREDVDTKERKLCTGGRILFMGPISEVSVGTLISVLMECRLEPDKENVEIIFYTDGGDFQAAQLFYDFLRTDGYYKKVTMIAGSKVSSAGLLMYLAAGKRLAYPSTVFLSHQLVLSISGASHVEVNERFKLDVGSYRDAVLQAVGQDTADTLAGDLENKRGNFFFSAKDAKQMGIVHEILTY